MRPRLLSWCLLRNIRVDVWSWMFCAFACVWDDIHYLDVKYGGVMKLGCLFQLFILDEII